MDRTKALVVLLVAPVLFGAVLGQYPSGGPANSYLPPAPGGGKPPGPSYGPPPGPRPGGPSGGANKPPPSYGPPGGGGGGGGGEGAEPEPYSFEYDVKDDSTGTDFSRKESSDGNTVTGEYRVLLPDGRTQMVTYKADDANGFQADVKYEGEAIPGPPGPGPQGGGPRPGGGGPGGRPGGGAPGGGAPGGGGGNGGYQYK